MRPPPRAAVLVFAVLAAVLPAGGGSVADPKHQGAIENYFGSWRMAGRFEEGDATYALKLEMCCPTNYSAAWDTSGELIAFVVDNLLCPKSAAAVRRNALEEAEWETQDENVARNEQFVGSSFPGVMGRPVSLPTARLLEVCVGPFIQRALQSSSQYLVTHSEHNRAFSASMDTDSSFFGSISLPGELLQSGAPHIDKDEEHLGLAMVYTITQNKSYDVTGTAFTKIPGLPSLSQNMGGSFHRERRIGQLARSPDRHGSSAYLGSTLPYAHQYQDLLHLVRCRFNRIVFYPTNRLHTAFIPRENLLVADPFRGRLTLNSFWGVTHQEAVTGEL